LKKGPKESFDKKSLKAKSKWKEKRK